jgi:muramidase (phage lysozyme)
MGRTKAEYQQLLKDPRTRALLNTIRFAEGTAGEKGYQTMFGGATFDDMSRHPDTVIDGGRYRSAAAGAYQFLPDTYSEVSQQLGLNDFQPGSQDVAALALIDRRGALDPFLQGDKFGAVMNRLAPEWASLPTSAGSSYYGQPVKSLGDLYSYYQGQKGALDVPTVETPTAGNTKIIQNFIQGEPEKKKGLAESFLDSFKGQILNQLLPF